MKTSEIYEACIPMLESGHRYICIAIINQPDEKVFWFFRSSKKKDFARESLMSRMQGHMILESFVADMRGYNGHPNKGEMKQLRIDLCKSLAAEFRAKGD